MIYWEKEKKSIKCIYYASFMQSHHLAYSSRHYHDLDLCKITAWLVKDFLGKGEKKQKSYKLCQVVQDYSKLSIPPDTILLNWLLHIMVMVSVKFLMWLAVFEKKWFGWRDKEKYDVYDVIWCFVLYWTPERVL